MFNRFGRGINAFLFLGLLLVVMLLGGLAKEVKGATTYFSDDFESGPGNWRMSGSDWDII